MLTVSLNVGWQSGALELESRGARSAPRCRQVGGERGAAKVVERVESVRRASGRAESIFEAEGFAVTIEVVRAAWVML